MYLVHKLERVLNACIRFICNISMNNHNLLPYYKECHILPIQYRIKYKLCLIAFKIVNNLEPQYLTDTTPTSIDPCKKISELEMTILF